MTYRARIGGFHATASKLSNHKLSFLNIKNIYAFTALAMYGACGVSTAILLFFVTHQLNATSIHPTFLNPAYRSFDTKIKTKNEALPREYVSIECLCLIIMFFLMCSMDVHLNPGPVITNISENISIIHNNIKSVKTKIDDLIVEATHHDIVTLSETLLTKEIKNDEINIPNFFPPFRRDRPNGWGGVAIYVRNTLFCKERPDLAVEDLEAIWIETKLKQETLLIGSFYRPPSARVHYWTLVEESIKKAMSTPHKFIILGDFNSDYINKPNENLYLRNIIQSNNLLQFIREYTRITNETKSCIDMIITPCRNLIDSVEVLPEINSDHKVVCAKLKTKIRRISTYKRQLINYSKLDENKLKTQLHNIDFEKMINEQDLDTSAELFSEKLFETVKLCVPIRIVTMRDNSAPWINEYILYLRADKNRIHILAKRVDTNEQWAIFRNIRNFYTNEIRKRKQEYIADLDEQIGNGENFGSKNWWKLVNRFLKNKDMYSDTIPPITDPENVNNTIYENLDKADCFNRYFKSQATVPDADDNPPPLPVRNNTMPQIILSVQEVENVINNLDSNKAVGPDLIHNKILKAASPVISKALTSLFNKSLSEGHFPSCWKTAHITPIHKKDSKSICSNYRPISLLSCVGKALEKCIQIRLLEFLKENNIINPCQSGFVPKDSTIYQLLNIYDDFCSSLDDKVPTEAIFFDISKAFDRVWHRGLVHKLYSVGIRGQLLTWFSNYLHNRTQAVVIKGQKSNYLNITAGVPQGSVLGPILFLIYINDLTNNIDSIIKLFADDTSMYLSLNDNPARTLTLNSDLDKIKTWASTWKVTFNANKTDKLNICNRNTTLPDSLYFDNVLLSTSTHHKHLGIILQNNCKWDEHITNLITRCRTHINCLCSYKYRLNRKSLEIMYKSYILPILDYADVIWDNCTERQADTLEQIQIDALKVITGSVRGTSHLSLYNDTGFVPLKERRKRHKLILYFKFTKGLLPEHLIPKFPPLASEVNQYHRRRMQDRYTMNCRTELYRHSFFPSATRLWNNLPENIQSARSFGEFKRHLKKDDITPPPYFYLGQRKEQIVHCRLRLGMSDLNFDLFNRHLSESKACHCGADKEDPHHYLLVCPSYNQTRQETLSNLPPIALHTKTLLNGNQCYSLPFNNFIFCIVHEYIKLTRRFD